jgi:hypothetical protein
MNIAALIGISGLAFIGVMALVCFTKVYGVCFLGSPRTKLHSDINENEVSFLVPMSILTAAIFLIGLFPLQAIFILENVLKQFIPAISTYELYRILPTFLTVTNAIVVFVGLIIFFMLIRSLLLRGKQVKEFKTWNCGYQAESSRIQYTSSSFVQPFLHLVNELVPQKIKVSKEQSLFPQEAHLESHTQDFSERYLIQPSINFLNKFMNLFSWIQSGRMQQYIIYGLLFLIFLLIWIIGAA